MRVSLLALAALASATLAAATWTPLPFTQSVIMGVDFSDAKTGYIAGGDNGVGANALSTTDGGQTFNSVPLAPAMMLLAVVSSSATDAAVTGLGILASGEQYTNDGKQFHNSSLPHVSMQTAQDIQYVDGNADLIAVTGQYTFFGINGSLNGVAFSNDGGATFEFSNVGGDPNVPARYGSFPSTQVAYVASGTWPPSRLAKGRKALTRNIHLHSADAQMHFEYEHEERENDSGWVASIFKGITDQTTGQRVWTQVYNNETFYMNQISCPSEDVCFAAAENDANGFALRTTDGGQTWEEILVAPGVSMMACHAISESEVYVAGGIIQPNDIGGKIFRSNDGGETFAVDNLPGFYLTDLSFPAEGAGFATAMNAQSQCNVLSYSE